MLQGVSNGQKQRLRWEACSLLVPFICNEMMQICWILTEKFKEKQGIRYMREDYMKRQYNQIFWEGAGSKSGFSWAVYPQQYFSFLQ